MVRYGSAYIVRVVLTAGQHNCTLSVKRHFLNRQENTCLLRRNSVCPKAINYSIFVAMYRFDLNDVSKLKVLPTYYKVRM